MRVKKQLLGIAFTQLILWLFISPAAACPSDSDGKSCKDCIVHTMKHNCPSCVSMLRCMAKCLWGGTQRIKCQNRCDCNGDKFPRLPDCRNCLSKCKCSCIS
ncbi:hypothetical protein Nepgr_007099 [Nepenthes gracilis]|uniref:TNFR-Cys domain-containing protein n=1 Tax=Nepenthes gracilis TaxID=150966 RepID=A0AAD3S6K2_NEPGR|nr:hypothetical protein Nepgr_007099 [Nepenthes gracilis]